MTLLTETYKNQIRNALSCFDRIIIQGTLPGFCYPEGMTSHPYQNKIRIFDYSSKFAMLLKEQIIHNAEIIAAEAGPKIEYIKKKNFRKVDKIAEIIKERGSYSGIVYFF